MSGYNLGSVRGTIVVDYNGAGIARATQDVDGLNKKGANTKEAFDKTSKGMAVAGGVIAGGLAFAAKSAMDFEKKLSGIKAVSGATQAQMDAISAKALQLGADTSFSAGESAAAMEELIKAGLSVDDVLNGAADATVNLAAAGEVALPEAAAIAANAMSMFGIAAKDVGGVADLIAGAANASAMSVGDFAQSLNQVGGVANLAGVSFKDTATAIALMAKEGYKGSDAGTSLKTMFMNLQPSTRAQRELFMDLGLVTKDGANQFYDAAGNLKSFADVSGVLNKALAGQTKEQKLANLEMMFGTDAIRAAGVMAKYGADGFNDMGAAMGKVTAADVAKDRLDNLSGAVEALQGSAETLAIQIGTPLLGSLRGVVVQVTDLVNWFSSLDSGTQANIGTVAAWAAGLLLGGAALIKIVGFARSMVSTLATLARVTGLAKLAQTLFNAEKMKDLVLSARLRAMYAADFLRGMIASMRAAVVQYGALAVAKARDLAQTAALRAMYAVDAMKGLASSIRAVVVQYGALAAAKARDMATTIASRVATMASTVATIAQTVAQRALNLAMMMNPLGLVIAAIVALVAIFVIAYQKSETFRAIVQAAFAAILSVVMSVVNWFRGVFATLWPWIASIIKVYMAIVRAYWSAVWAVVGAVIRTVASVIKAVVSGIVTGIRTYFNTIKTVVTTVWNFVASFIKGAIDRVKAAIGLISNIGSIVGGYFGKMRTAISEKVGQAVAFVGGIPGKIKSGLGALGTLLYDAGKSVIQGLINGIENMVGSLMAKAGEIAGRIKDKITGALKINSPSKVMIPVGSAVPEGIGVGIEEGQKDLMRIAGALAYNTAAAASPAVSGASAGGFRPMVPTTSTYAPTVQVQVDAPQAANADQIGFIVAARVGNKLSTGATSPIHPGRM